MVKPIDKGLARGTHITYRNGQSGEILTTTAKGGSPVYSETQDGLVIAHRSDGKVAERVDGPYDIVPLSKALIIRVWLVQGSDSVMRVSCALDRDPSTGQGDRVLKQWEHSYDGD